MQENYKEIKFSDLNPLKLASMNMIIFRTPNLKIKNMFWHIPIGKMTEKESYFLDDFHYTSSCSHSHKYLLLIGWAHADSKLLTNFLVCHQYDKIKDKIKYALKIK